MRMTRLEISKSVYTIISQASDISSNDDYILLHSHVNLKESLDALGFRGEEIDGKFRFKPKEKNLIIFTSTEKLLSSPNFNISFDYLVLTGGNNSLAFIEGKTYIDFTPADFNFTFINIVTYRKFIAFLKTLEAETVSGFAFVDHFNIDYRRILMLNTSENIRLHIKYQIKTPVFDSLIDYSLQFERFSSEFKNEDNNYLKFVKNAAITKLLSVDIESRLKVFFVSLENILNQATINFDVYLNEVSIDKLRQEYENVKFKYFEQISDLTSKFTHQILALPIAISATLFAIDNLKTNWFYLLVVLLSILVGSGFLLLLLKINFKDLNYIKRVLDNEYEQLKSNNFFIKHTNELTVFTETKNQINSRIKFLWDIITIFIYILIISNILIIGHALTLFNLSHSVSLLICLLLFFVVANYADQLINNKDL